MKYLSIRERLLEEQRENERLKAENVKLSADLDYIAMMCDVDLETEQEGYSDE